MTEVGDAVGYFLKMSTARRLGGKEVDGGAACFGRRRNASITRGRFGGGAEGRLCCWDVDTEVRRSERRSAGLKNEESTEHKDNEKNKI